MELHRDIRTNSSNNTQNLNIIENIAYDLLLPVDFKPKYTSFPGLPDDRAFIIGDDSSAVADSNDNPKVTIISSKQIDIQDLRLGRDDSTKL